MTAGEAAQQRDLETLACLPPSHSDPSGWVPQTQRTLFWTRASLITKAQAGRERRGLKGEEGKDWGQREGQERMSANSAPSVHLRSLHPSLHPHPPSCPSPLLPSSWPVFTLAVNDFSEGADWDISVFKLKQASLFKLSMNWHPLSPLSLSHVVLSGLPLLPSSSPHDLLFILQLSSLILLISSLCFLSLPPLPPVFPTSLSYTSCHSCLRSLWTSLPVQF